MESLRSETTRLRSLDVALAGLFFVAAGGLAAACGDGAMQVRVAPDAAPDASADTGEAAPDAAEDASVASDVAGAADATADAEASTDGASERSPVSDARDAPEAPAPRPSATASWTLAPNPMCAASGAGCMDTGVVGGYQITASGTCPTSSDLQLWFPGGAAPLGPGIYAVKPAAGILDVIAMPAGMVGVLAERAGASPALARLWGRAGSVTVTATATARRVTFSGVTVRDEASGATTTLAAEVSCP